MVSGGAKGFANLVYNIEHSLQCLLSSGALSNDANLLCVVPFICPYLQLPFYRLSAMT